MRKNIRHKFYHRSRQNQARSALLFLYDDVLERDPGPLEQVAPAKRSRNVPVVSSAEEASAVPAAMKGENALVARLLYGAGLRLIEALRLRVKDLDFERRQITVRDGKGNKDRLTRSSGAVGFVSVSLPDLR
jgi:integrase